MIVVCRTGDHRLLELLTYKRERERERACVRACESARLHASERVYVRG
jgi:hypothetical protein